MHYFREISLSGGTVIFSSRLLEEAGGVKHAFTTRKGGVSEGVYSSLNIGINRGDSRENVLENYRLLARALGFDESNVALTAQVHGDTIRIVEEGGGALDPVPFSCDALITNKPGIALFVFTADCVPVLLYDPAARCIGAIHAGWRGTANGIVAKTIKLMGSEYGSKPADILAAIGPSIGRCCFEVDKPVYSTLKETYPDIESYADIKGEKYFPDLKELNRVMLERCGIPAERISVSSECTKCDPSLFWSHRRDGNNRGLQGAVIIMGR